MHARWPEKRALRRHPRVTRIARGVAEELERRHLMATVSVSTLNDVSNGNTSSIANLIATPGADGISYREALTAANNTAGADAINFSVGGTINILSPLPVITGQVSIVASTNGTPSIELNGAAAGADTNGMEITSGNSTIRGLAINRFGRAGISLRNVGGNTIAGCYLGLNLAGVVGLSNIRGIFIENTPNNTVGGTAASDRNVISGNTNGVVVAGTLAINNKIQGNYIGTNASGVQSVPNAIAGILLTRYINGAGQDAGPSSLTTVGGTAAGAGNLISGNTRNGIEFFSGTHDNTVQGNRITSNGGAGTDPAGGFGIDIFGSNSNTIGGDDDDDGNLDGDVRARNVISGNSRGGVWIEGGGTLNLVAGNLIGLNTAATAAQPNGGPGVLLDGVSGNTIGETSDGAGNIISGNVGDGVLIQGGGTNNNIFGNRIGTNAAGLSPIGNQGHGVRIVNSPGNFIGGPTSAIGFHAGNLISGNLENGVFLTGDTTTGTGIYGNLIGTTITATAALPNFGEGVAITFGASQNFVGGPDQPGGQLRNVTSGNNFNGVYIDGEASTANQILNNRIGTSESGMLAVPNGRSGVTIWSPANIVGTGNLISGNTEWGVNFIGGFAAANKLLASTIGINSSGNAQLRNQAGGVLIQNAPSNEIGGSGAGNTISGHGIQEGIKIEGELASGNKIWGNIIGLNTTGSSALPNFRGVVIDQAPNTQVGGTTSLAGTGLGNLISGNSGTAIVISGNTATGNMVQGNLIGLDVTGLIEQSNSGGVLVENAPANQIGGVTTTPGENLGNVIAGSFGPGIKLAEAGSSDNLIRGNVIGLARDRITARPNSDGIIIDGGSNNRVGGVNPGDGNIIAGNGRGPGVGGRGVSILAGTQNAIQRNLIYKNRAIGIEHGGAFRVNDPDDADTGANELQNAPIVRKVEFGVASKYITFQLFTTPSATPRNYIWEFYRNPGSTQQGFGEGKELIATQTFAVNASGYIELVLTVGLNEAFVTATVTDPAGNTSPFSLPDSDADGLTDKWEVSGVDSNLDEVIDLTLSGANPNKKDIFVEVDAMSLTNPDTDALQDVVDAFANAPAASVQNADGSAGINLHIIDGGDWDIPTEPWIDVEATTGNFPTAFGLTKNGKQFDQRDGHIGTPDQRSILNLNWINTLRALLMTHKYCLFVYTIPGAGGIGELDNQAGIFGGIHANDFAVAMGEWNVIAQSRDMQAGGFMHELGHTLGLHHGGNDEDNYKPNYFSVMNYLWHEPQRGYESSWRLDYSREKLPTIDESNFSESAGFGGTPGLVVPYGPIFNVATNRIQKAKLGPQAGPADFDEDGTIENSITRDLNFLDDDNGDGVINALDSTIEPLNGYDDWSNINLSFNFSRTEFRDGLSFGQFLQLDSIGNGPGTFQFARELFRTAEGTQSAQITVVRAGGTDGAVSVQYQTVSGGTATPGGDYATTLGTLNFADGEYLKTFTIPLVDDSVLEGTETISMQLLNAIGAPLGTRATAQVQVTEPMVAKLVEHDLQFTESVGTIPIHIVLTGEAGQTLSNDIRVGLNDLLTGTALPGVNYNAPDIVVPAGTSAGTTLTLNLQVIDTVVSEPDLTIEAMLSPIDSFATVAQPDDMLTIRIIDGAQVAGFYTPEEYTGNFREIFDEADYLNYSPSGTVNYNGGFFGTALYDTTPNNGIATINTFGGGISREVYSVDFLNHPNDGIGLYARVPGSSNGGYWLTLSSGTQFDITKNPSVDFSNGSSGIPLAHYGDPFNPVQFLDLESNDWYTLVFTVQNNAAGTAVHLTGQVFQRGQTGGAPIAEFSAIDSNNPFVAPGQTGFSLYGVYSPGPDLDNFSIDVSANVNAGQSFTLTESFNVTSLVVSGNLTVASGGNKVLVTNDLFVSGQLDLSNNPMIIERADATMLSRIRSALQSGYAGGLWNGSGISSSTAAAVAISANPHKTAIGYAPRSAIGNPASFAGQTLKGPATLLRYTLYGDANLDLKVNTLDFNALAANFNASNRAFSDGDFNYDGIVNSLDFSALAANYGAALTAPFPSSQPNDGEEARQTLGALMQTVAGGLFSQQFVLENDEQDIDASEVAGLLAL